MSTPLASLEYALASGRRGRVFVSASRISQLDPQALGRRLEEAFIEPDDHERLALAQRALTRPSVLFELYPGESHPAEFHAYIRSPEVSDAPIFACVIASRAVLEAMLANSPQGVFETASLEVVDSEITNRSLAAALERWARRVWPEDKTGRIELEPWVGAVEVIARALQHAAEFPPHAASLEAALASAVVEDWFSPDENLVPAEFRFEGEAA